jgi:hypothetical protein
MTQQRVATLLASSVVFVMLSCQSATTRFDSKIQSGHCEDAMNDLPPNDPLVKVSAKTTQAARSATYYTAVGAGYAAEVLWDASAGLLEGVLLCAPMIAATSAGNGATSVSPQVGVCLGESDFPKLKKLYAPPLGKQMRSDLRYLQCPKLAGLSRSLRAVSACYFHQGQADKARAQLLHLKDSADFYNCLPTEEQDAVTKQIQLTESNPAVY